MIISIAILLLARRVFSSLLVQGSISTFNKDTVSINLHANKLSANNLDELFGKLREALLKKQIYLMIDLGGKVIDIQGKMMEADGRIDHKQNYLDHSDEFDRIIPINTAEFKRTYMVDDIINILRHMTLKQEYNVKNEKIRNLFLIEDLLYNVISREHQNLMNLNQVFESSQTVFNGKFIFEKNKWDSESELEIFFEYAKSVHDSLLWLSRLLDVKRYELCYVFDDIIKWKLLNLHKQAEFLLKNLIEKRKRFKKTKSKKYQDFPKDKSMSTVSNIRNIESGKVTISNKKDQENFNKTDKAESLTKEIKAKTNFNEIYDDTRTMDKNITNNQIAPKIEMRILNFSELLKNIGPKSKHKNVTIEASPASKEFTVKKSTGIANNPTSNDTYTQKKKILRNKNFFIIRPGSVDKQNFLKPKTSVRMINKSIKLGDHRNWFNRLKNISTVLPSKSITSALKKNDQKQIGTFLKKNVTNIPTSLSRRTLQILDQRNKNKLARKQKNQHYVSRENDVTNYRGDSNAKLHTKISTIDEILEAINGILPRRKPAQMSSPISN